MQFTLIEVAVIRTYIVSRFCDGYLTHKHIFKVAHNICLHYLLQALQAGFKITLSVVICIMYYISLKKLT